MLLLFAVFAIFIGFTFWRQRKQQKAQQEQQAQLGPGVEVMTSFGLFGTVQSVDEADNKIVLELSPGNTATVHRQAVTKILTPASVEAEESPVVPDDASSLTGPYPTESTPAAAKETLKDTTNQAANETAEETLARLNKENEKDK
ncbi:preprotein translocase subunit YajC [Psychromicrobium lacuslunae]|uniref:Preprotein translocase subunit YajC n=1 Tax=Psychromicrobium lacuslunae TaxID=1618207 RepID=A0A0D4BXB3_9MICC|nr:preprotein translocase subunit YajC [Psychromicrobium lacuslunae]AJT40964.1 preprotein translocase subunit YajC [Psychromicrobium lacuslunae]